MGPREQEIRHVGASNQQHQPRSAEQRQKRRTDVSNQVSLQRNDLKVEGRLGKRGELATKMRGDHFDFLLRQRNTSAITQASDHP